MIPALQSRCTRFKFKQIPLDSAVQRIIQICSIERINLNEEAIKAVFRLCQGDMRRVVNMLQSLSMLGTDEQISEDTVYSFTGNPSPATLKQYMEILLNDDIQTAYAKL